MGRFLEDYLARVSPELRRYCVDYARIKDLINEIEQQALKTDDVASLHGLVDAFSRQLEYEAGRAAAAYDEKIEQAVHKLKYIRRKWAFLSPETLPTLYNDLKDVARTLQSALVFVEVNAEAVNRLLVSAEKRFLLEQPRQPRSARGLAKPALPLSSRTLIGRDDFLSKRLRPDDVSALRKLRLHRGLDVVIEEIRQRLDALRIEEMKWHNEGLVDTEYVRHVHRHRNTLPLLLDLQKSAVNTVNRTKWFMGLLAKAQIDFEKEPVGYSNTYGLILNNINTFLYMANYYVVIPSANSYAAAVGLAPAVSGFLLAMAPLSSLLASIIYSFWSNRSFKEPLFFCTLLLIIGNFLYSAALDYKSPWMLFAGRLLVGLGGNRAVNRRYIADFVSLRKRTFHSAVFVAVGSLGMSIGPGCQYFFEYLNFRIFGFTVNNLTAAGWLMGILWVIFAVQVLFKFEEPKRIHIKSGNSELDLFEPLLTDRNSNQVLITANDVDLREPALQRVQKVSTGSMKSGRTAIVHATTKQEQEITANRTGIYLCLWVYFVLKLTQEAFQATAPIFTESTFGWTDAHVGYLLGVIGVVVLPSNLLLGWFSEHIDERDAIVVSLVAVIGAAIWSTDITSQRTYITSAIVLFLAAQLLEAVNMSLLSRVMPRAMSQGLWNSGFLSTEAGTFGRVVGCVLLSLMGTFFIWLDPADLQLLVMAPCVVLMVITAVLLIKKRRTLVSPADLALVTSRNVFNVDSWAALPELTPLCVQFEEIKEQERSERRSFLRRFASTLTFVPGNNSANLTEISPRTVL